MNFDSVNTCFRISQHDYYKYQKWLPSIGFPGRFKTLGGKNAKKIFDKKPQGLIIGILQLPSMSPMSCELTVPSTPNKEIKRQTDEISEIVAKLQLHSTQKGMF